MSDLATESGAVKEQRALVERICASRAFARTVRLREFLLHIARRSWEGRARELTELDIARHVFDRDESFVPVDDSVVRGSARQLRLKLREYFEGEGAGETWRLEVPKGSYVPLFTQAAPTPAQPSPPTHPPAASERIHWLGLSLAANALLVIALLLLVLSRGFAPRPPDSLITAFLRGASGAVPLIVSDFSLAGMNHMAGSRQGNLTLDQYAVWDYSPLIPPPGASPDAVKAFDLFRSHRLTRSGDLSLAVRILQGAGLERRVAVRHARDVAPRELRGGSHIILGNPYSTPWSAPYENSLGFRWLMGVGYRDESPRAGEPSVYRISEPSYFERGSGYGRLAAVPNFSGQGQVLLLSGINMVTMEAAGEAALDPAIWSEIQGLLGLRRGDPLPSFEVLLKTEALDNTPQHAKVIKARLLPAKKRTP